MYGAIELLKIKYLYTLFSRFFWKISEHAARWHASYCRIERAIISVINVSINVMHDYINYKDEVV